MSRRMLAMTRRSTEDACLRESVAYFFLFFFFFVVVFFSSKSKSSLHGRHCVHIINWVGGGIMDGERGPARLLAYTLTLVREASRGK